MKIVLFRGVVLFTCVAALALTACGSDDEDSEGDGSATSAEPLTHDELVDQATAACEQAQQSSNELNEQLGDADVFAPESAPLLEDLASVTDQLVSELQALQPPTDDAKDYETLVGLLDEGTTAVEEIAQAVQDGDRDTALALQNEVNASGEEIERVATDLGLTACLAG